MVTRRTNRFTDQTPDTSGILAGITDSINPKYSKGFIRRNLKEFPSLPQNPAKYAGMSPARLRRLATAAVLKQRGIKPPAKPRKKTKPVTPKARG